MSARNREGIAKALRQVKFQEMQAHRLEGFTPVIDTDYQCATCWLMGKHSSLTPGYTAAPEKFLRCGTCGYEILVARH